MTRLQTSTQAEREQLFLRVHADTPWEQKELSCPAWLLILVCFLIGMAVVL